MSCIFVLGILAAYALATYFSRPIMELGDAAGKLARGDYSARAHGRRGCLKDEIDELCCVFNDMADQISSAYSTLEQKNCAVSSTSCAKLLHHIKKQNLLHQDNAGCRLSEGNCSSGGAVQEMEDLTGYSESPVPAWLFSGQQEKASAEAEEELNASVLSSGTGGSASEKRPGRSSGQQLQSVQRAESQAATADSGGVVRLQRCGLAQASCSATEVTYESTQRSPRADSGGVMRLQRCGETQASCSATEGCQPERREEDLALPVVLLTPGGPDDKPLCKELGVQLYVPKPVKRKVLTRRVKQALKLPLQDGLSASNSSASEEASASAAAERSLKVLVAEDNIVNQRVAMTLLRKWGHEAVLASDGEEAVEKVQAEVFDVILMDVQMPVCDGLQATKRIREYESTTKRHTPIIAMTAQALIGDGMKCIEAGMDSYMSKPLNASKLKDLLRLVCQSHVLPKPTNDCAREF
ncbi:unnamed protein product [Closterium sp. Naga37s-1]|nr:unnamed protein product [Closterium sp. Naga37s-1]